MGVFLDRKIFVGGGGDTIITGQEIVSGTLFESVEAFDTVRIEPKYYNPLDNLLTITGSLNPAASAVSNIATDLSGEYFALLTSEPDTYDLFKRTGDTITKLNRPTGLPSNIIFTGGDFSSNGTYLALTSNTSPRLFILKKDQNDVFTLLSTPIDTPDVNSTFVTFSYDDVYLAVSFTTTVIENRVVIFKRDNDTFTRLANVDVPPTGLVSNIEFSVNGDYLATIHSNSPRLSIYKRTGDVFEKLPNPTGDITGIAIPTQTPFSVAFSPDNTYLVVGGVMTVNTTGSVTAPSLYVYKRNEDVFTKLSTPRELTPAAVRAVEFTLDSNRIIVGTNLKTGEDNIERLNVYKIEEDEFILLPNVSFNLLNKGIRDIVYPINSNYIFIGYSTADYYGIFKVLNNTILKANNMPGTDGILGYALQSGIKNQTINVMSLFEVS
jgi:hypothetical protein